MITVVDETITDTAAAATSPRDTCSDDANGDKDMGVTPARACATAAVASKLPILQASNIATNTSANMNTIMDKPTINNSDLMSRLQNFLPQLKSANQELLSSSENPFPIPPSGLRIGSTSNSNLNPVLLDANLKLNEDSDSDSDSDSNEKLSNSNPLISEVGAVDPEHKGKHETKYASDSASNTVPNDANNAPTIQLEFTLGNMSDNPLMKLLANDGDDDDDNSDSSSGDSNGDIIAGKTTDEVARRKVVANLLQTTTDTKNNACESKEKTKNSGTKRLIEELS